MKKGRKMKHKRMKSEERMKGEWDRMKSEVEKRNW